MNDLMPVQLKIIEKFLPNLATFHRNQNVITASSQGRIDKKAGNIAGFYKKDLIRLLLLELQGRRVHTISESCRLGPIIEHMPNMRMTARTQDFRAILFGK